MSWEAKQVLSSGLMVSFRSAREISSYSVRAKIYLLERTAGSNQRKKTQIIMSQNQCFFKYCRR